MNVSFLSLLCILFIGLKLTGYIAWSWVWVLAPVWIPFVMTTVILGIGIILFLVKVGRE